MARKYLTSIDLNKNQLIAARLENLGSAPGTPGVGQVYFDTTGGVLRLLVWDGTAWQRASFLTDPFARANHTGTQTASTISDFDTQVRTSRLDQMTAPNTSVAFNSQKITGLANGTSATDAVNFGQLSAVASGIDWKESVRVATTAAQVLASDFENGDTIDGVVLVTGNRVLIKDQASGLTNGIYTVNASGAPTRALDADSSAEVTGGMAVWVNEGTTNADTGWVLTTNDAIVLDTTALTFTQFSGLGQVTAGNGLTKSGNTLNFVGDATLSVAADTVGVATGGIGTTQLADGSVTGGTAGAGVKIAATTITNANINASAAIAYSKLALTGAILNADLAGSIAYSKLVLTGAILNADLAGSIALSKLATDPLARANHTGTQTASTISDLATVVKAYRLDEFAAPNTSVAFGSQKITGLLAGTASTDAVNKGQLDAVSAGLDPKASVRAASTATVSVTYNATNGTSARGQITAVTNTIDGVTLVATDRVLLKDQSTGAQNGIWVVTTAGTGANGVWDRATDFDTDAEVTAGAFTFVTEGTVNADTGWVLSTNDPIVIGGGSGTALVWTQFSSAGVVLAGAGLLKTGNTIDITTAGGSGITVGTDTIAVDTAVVVRKYAVSFGDGAAVAYTITHNLGTQDVTVSVYDNTTPYAELGCDVEHTTTNTVILRFSIAPTSNQYRCVVHG